MSDLSQVAVSSDSSDVYKVSEDDEMHRVVDEGVRGKVTKGHGASETLYPL